MKKLVMIMSAMAFFRLLAHSEVTLDHCLEKAAENYPLVSRYGLVEKTADLSLSDINKSWLPRLGVYGQATVQNEVPEFPESLRGVLQQLGQDYRGLDKLQYKIGVELSQTIWDGGSSRARREITRASSAEQQAALDVQMYSIRERVMNLYFGILLMNEQIAETENTLSMLTANCRLMQSMLKGGVAMQSDVDMVEAQALVMSQKLAGARSAVKGYRELLSIFVGEDLEEEELVRPDADIPDRTDPDRPELKLYDAQKRVNTVRNAAVESSVMPKMGFFAQAYYGYPGYNYFESMITRGLSFNLLAGVKITWDIDSFYTRKNSQKRYILANDGIENDREIFLFNNRLQTDAQLEEIAGIRDVMADDERIVALRGNVRRAAESQLSNGVIDATALLSKITDENQARLTARYHQIQLIQSIYKLKNILNR